MSIYLEITQLENGDIVLRETEATDREDTERRAESSTLLSASTETGEREPLVRISFSNEVKDLLGNELVDVAEAMIDAATDFLDGETIALEPQASTPVIH